MKSTEKITNEEVMNSEKQHYVRFVEKTDLFFRAHNEEGLTRIPCSYQ